MSKELEPVAWNVTDNETGEQILYHNIYSDNVAGFTAEPLYVIPEGYALVPVEEATDEMAAAFMGDDRPWISGREWWGSRESFNRSYKAMIKAYRDATFPQGSVVECEV